MIETIIKNYLDDVQDLPVLFEQQPGIDECYIVEKTGAGGTQHIKTAMLAIQSYADTMAKAARLNEQLIALMYDAIRLPEVSEVELNSSYNYTDRTTKRYRYQAVFNIVHY